jgi:UDP-glucuronate decarboxylase
VDDAVDGLVRLMRAPAGVTPINFGGSEDVLLRDVANLIIDMTGSSSKIVYEPSLPFLTELAIPNTQKSREIGWLPLTRLQDGLRQTIEFIKANKVLLTNV